MLTVNDFKQFCLNVAANPEGNLYVESNGILEPLSIDFDDIVSLGNRINYADNWNEMLLAEEYGQIKIEKYLNNRIKVTYSTQKMKCSIYFRVLIAADINYFLPKYK